MQQQYSVSESFTAGWINVLLRQLWPTVIEAKGSELAKKGLQKVLDKVLAVHSGRMLLFQAHHGKVLRLWNAAKGFVQHACKSMMLTQVSDVCL